MQVQILAAVAAAGAIGAVARYLLALAMQVVGAGAPWPVFVVNLVGCFGFGLVHAVSAGRWSPALATAVLVGFFGAFTTFSAFAFDCVELLREGRWVLCLGNAALQNVLGLAALLLGAWLGGGVPVR